MELKDAIRTRYSVRQFSQQPVSKAMILEILELASMAPSAVNFQPWHFIVITGKDGLAELWPVYHRQWLQEAPVIIVACIDHHQSWKRSNDGHDFGEVDVAIVVDHLTLAATASGLGTCWVCNFDVAAARKILHLPEQIEPLALIPVGFPAVVAAAKKRKPLSESVSWESFGHPLSLPAE